MTNWDHGGRCCFGGGGGGSFGAVAVDWPLHVEQIGDVVHPNFGVFFAGFASRWVPEEPASARCIASRASCLIYPLLEARNQDQF